MFCSHRVVDTLPPYRIAPFITLALLHYHFQKYANIALQVVLQGRAKKSMMVVSMMM